MSSEFVLKFSLGEVVKAIELVGGYSISLKELQDILSYLYTGQAESWVRIASPLSTGKETDQSDYSHHQL